MINCAGGQRQQQREQQQQQQQAISNMAGSWVFLLLLLLLPSKLTCNGKLQLQSNVSAPWQHDDNVKGPQQLQTVRLSECPTGHAKHAKNVTPFTGLNYPEKIGSTTATTAKYCQPVGATLCPLLRGEGSLAQATFACSSSPPPQSTPHITQKSAHTVSLLGENCICI